MAGSALRKLVAGGNHLRFNVQRHFVTEFGNPETQPPFAAANAWTVDPAMAASAIMPAFVIVTIGGLGSYTGAIVAGLMVGVVTALTIQFWPAAAGAAMYALTERTLHRTCVEFASESPLKLIHRQVAFEAQRMLLHTSMTISEISEQTGFEEAQAFSRFFIEVTGEAPGAFRRNRFF